MPKAILDLCGSDAVALPEVLASNAAPLRRVAGGNVTADDYLFEAAGYAFFARFEFTSQPSDGKDDDRLQ